MLLEAGQPEIFRAAQRDETFKKYLTESISGILQPIFGIHFWIKHKDLIERLSNVLYQCITTLSNLQTLGEEYTGIIQINKSVKSLPKKHHQLLMILLNNFGELTTISALFPKIFGKSFEEFLWVHFFNDQLQKILLFRMIKALCDFLKFHLLPSFLKIHKALFYFYGHYYELSKRLCGIKYVLVRYWLKDRSSLSAFKLLGIVTLIQSILGLFSTIPYKGNLVAGELQQTDFRVNELEKNVHEKCPLCLNNMQMPSVTPCGHLFCWPCIFDWLQEQPKCPLCRVLSTIQSLRWNHYKSLGLTPSATMSEIKAAYYKLSKIYHPDRNNGSEASAKKFRDIVAAYEVLSKADSRRQYDREMIRKYDFVKTEGPKRKGNKRIKKASTKVKPHFKTEFPHTRSKYRSGPGRGKGMSRCEQEEIENFIVRAIPFVVACLMCCKKR